MKYLKTYEEINVSIDDDDSLILMNNYIKNYKFSSIENLIKSGFDFSKFPDLINYAGRKERLSKKDLEVLRLIINSGVDVNLKDRWGRTPLSNELFKDGPNLEYIKILIKSGANINMSVDFGTFKRPYIIIPICQYHDKETAFLKVMRELFRNNPDLSMKDSDGKDFIDFLVNTSSPINFKENILEIMKEELPEQYEEYLLRADAKKYNL